MSVPAVRRVVVGVDGSVESVAALRWACREASLRGAEVHAVHVREEHCHSLASYAVPPLSTADDLSVDIDDFVRSVKAGQAPEASRCTSKKWTASPHGSSLTAARARTCWCLGPQATCLARVARPARSSAPACAARPARSSSSAPPRTRCSAELASLSAEAAGEVRVKVPAGV